MGGKEGCNKEILDSVLELEIWLLCEHRVCAVLGLLEGIIWNILIGRGVRLYYFAPSQSY